MTEPIQLQQHSLITETMQEKMYITDKILRCLWQYDSSTYHTVRT